jgi:hypothetical protein
MKRFWKGFRKGVVSWKGGDDGNRSLAEIVGEEVGMFMVPSFLLLLLFCAGVMGVLFAWLFTGGCQ